MTISGNLLSIIKFWLASLHPFSKAITQSSKHSEISTTVMLMVRPYINVKLLEHLFSLS